MELGAHQDLKMLWKLPKQCILWDSFHKIDSLSLPTSFQWINGLNQPDGGSETPFQGGSSVQQWSWGLTKTWRCCENSQNNAFCEILFTRLIPSHCQHPFGGQMDSTNLTEGQGHHFRVNHQFGQEGFCLLLSAKICVDKTMGGRVLSKQDRKKQESQWNAKPMAEPNSPFHASNFGPDPFFNKA